MLSSYIQSFKNPFTISISWKKETPRRENIVHRCKSRLFNMFINRRPSDWYRNTTVLSLSYTMDQGFSTLRACLQATTFHKFRTSFPSIAPITTLICFSNQINDHQKISAIYWWFQPCWRIVAKTISFPYKHLCIRHNTSQNVNQ